MIIAPRHQHSPGRPLLRGICEVTLVLLALYLLVLGLSASAKAIDVMPTNEILQLEVQKGTIIRIGRPAATVFVADPAVADVESRSQRSVFIYGKESGETTLYALDAEDRAILTVLVRVTHNLSRLNTMIRSISDSEVTVTSIDGGIVVVGTVEDPQTAAAIIELTETFIGEDETLINRLSIAAPTQVNLRVRFAEVSREVLRVLGVTWRAQDLIDIDPLTGLVNPEKTTFSVFSTRPDFTLDAESNVASITQNFGPVSLNATIDALEKEGLISLLAEPNLTALSGETATFLAGGEFPVPVGVDDNEIGIEFKEFGVRLAFTPTVLSGNRISLRVRPEVSQLSDQGAIILQNIQIPALSTRRAETTIELASGQSFAIAGLVQNRVSHDINKVPGLGDVPILGQLFQSKRFQDEETELVIIATPYLVKPIGAGQRPALPTDRPETDRQFERLLNNQLSQSEPEDGSVASEEPRGQLSGPVGFMLD